MRARMLLKRRKTDVSAAQMVVFEDQEAPVLVEVGTLQRITRNMTWIASWTSDIVVEGVEVVVEEDEEAEADAVAMKAHHQHQSNKPSQQPKTSQLYPVRARRAHRHQRMISRLLRQQQLDLHHHCHHPLVESGMKRWMSMMS